MSDPVTAAIAAFSDELDVHYNFNGSGFDDTYNYVIREMRKNETYNATDYPESSSARNFSTAQKLSVDCN